jgi:hypothetical protein
MAAKYHLRVSATRDGRVLGYSAHHRSETLIPPPAIGTQMVLVRLYVASDTVKKLQLRDAIITDEFGQMHPLRTEYLHR